MKRLAIFSPDVWVVVIALATVIFAPATATAAIFRWTDDNGRQRFSDRPPVGQRADDAVDEEYRPRSRMDGGKTPTGIVRKRGQGKVTLSPSKENGMRCGHYRDAIARIDSKLRAGYRAKAGRKLEERRRHYSDWMFRHCR